MPAAESGRGPVPTSTRPVRSSPSQESTPRIEVPAGPSRSCRVARRTGGECRSERGRPGICENRRKLSDEVSHRSADCRFREHLPSDCASDSVYRKKATKSVQQHRSRGVALVLLGLGDAPIIERLSLGLPLEVSLGQTGDEARTQSGTGVPANQKPTRNTSVLARCHFDSWRRAGIPASATAPPESYVPS